MSKRGISVAVGTKYGLMESTYDGRPSIKYPTFGMGGGQAHRHKFIDGQKPKYKWDGRTDQSLFKYYSAGGMKKAIEEAGGLLYWLSGEPDVWTWFETGNGYNATCCFGEGSVPDSVADDLKVMGVKSVIMYPDLDKPGMEAAWKLRDRLVDSGIMFMAYRLPGDMGSKRDLNQIWQDIDRKSVV